MIAADILAAIPGCAGGTPPLRVLPLPGGRGCNVVLRVDTAAGRFVLRQRQPPLDRPGASAQLELQSQQLAAAARLAPRIISSAPDGSWLLMEYIDAPTWTEQQLLSRDGVGRLGARLAQLHALAPPDLPGFDAPAIAAGYIEQLYALDTRVAQDHLPLLARVRELTSALTDQGAGAVLNHGDLQTGNLLGDQPWLIDWEYAQIADPTYDIACLLTYYPALDAHLDVLLASAQLSRAAQMALPRQQQRFACLNRLWTAVHGTKAG